MEVDYNGLAATPIFWAALTMLFNKIYAASLPNEITWSCHTETDSCYYLPDRRNNYLEASCWCRTAGGHLVKLDSTQEVTLMGILIAAKGFNDFVYIGATDLKTENEFIWEDGTGADLIPWHVWSLSSEEPNNWAGNEHCATISARNWASPTPESLGGVKGLDKNCQDEFFFICEKDKESWSQKLWVEASSDLKYSSAELKSVPEVSLTRCGVLCTTNCECFSFGYKQDGGHCILYNAYQNRWVSPQPSPGYIIFE